MRRLLRLATVMALACAASATAPLGHPARAADGAAQWTRTWGTAMAAASAAETGITGRQTLRMVVHTSVGGSTARIQLVNTFSKEPVTIGHATLARRASGGTARAVPLTLTFGGARRTVIGPGESVFSDPAAFPVDAGEDLLVSIHLPDPVRSVPFHEYALTTSYISADGDTADRTEETGAGGFPTKFRHWAFLGGLDVTAGGSGGTVVTIGDSQTDGGHSTPDTDRRWPDAYARNLRALGRPMGVVNAGISANRLLSDHDSRPGIASVYGPSALERFDRDALSQPNVKSVVLYEGINDIVLDDAKSPELIAGIRQLAARSHAAGIGFTAATIPPFKGSAYFTAEREAVRQEVNAYIRSTRDVDARLDFDRATRDPLDNQRLFGAYPDPADHLHFNDNGCQALADAATGSPAPAPFTPNFSQTAAADFTGDGVADLVARNSRGELYLWKGSGDGTFEKPVFLTGDWNYTQTVAGDFTGDGKADLIARDADARLYLWAGRGDGTFDRPRLLTGGWDFTQTAAADFTGDGIADLVARDAKGDLYLWTGERDGTFSRPKRLTGEWDYTQTVAGDFTGDGRADLIARGGDGTLYLWTGNGDGTFGRPKVLTGDWNYSETAAGAFYGGGTAHLVARSDASGVLYEWVNRGDADFSRGLRLTDGW
ncbi:FG-GAP-like repeat-containing protein [Streptomyces morookaense]|uniref:FG-GAP-like repeat-containing protein n=1 Tax=Streptomyces morookaense TaxID=1970 RepID=UPI0033C33A43